MVTIAMSMISGKLGEDKQNKQEKSETAVRESIGVVPLALPLMAGPGAISSTIVWGTRYHSRVHLVGFHWRLPSLPSAAGDFPHGAVAGASARADRDQRYHPYYGPAADGPWH